MQSYIAAWMRLCLTRSPPPAFNNAGAELVTSNLAVMPSALLAGRISIRQLLQNWFVAYFGNFAGSLFVAGALIYGTGLTVDAPWGDFLRALTVKKIMGASWGQQVSLDELARRCYGVT